MVSINRLIKDKRFQNIITISLFVLYFVLGILMVRDYGVSTDEPQERKTMYVNMNYILTQLGRESMDVPELATYKDKYYGMAMQMPMCVFELLGEEHLPLIYLCRHIYTFLICYIGYIFFFLCIKKMLHSNLWGVIGTLMLSLYPRFIAEQFYNIKDMVFMSMFIISMWATIELIENNFSKKWIAIFAVMVAVTTNVRIVGIVFLMLVLGYLWLMVIMQSFYRDRLYKDLNWKKALGVTISVLLIFIIIFATSIPGIWENPIRGIYDVFVKFSDYSGGGNVVFMGNVMENTNIPWYYIPIWILISVPIWYIVCLLLSGIICINHIIKYLKQADFIGLLCKEKYVLWTMMLFIMPWFGMVIMKSNLYNGWRHCYFMVPPMILLIIFGLARICVLSRVRCSIVCVLLVGLVSQCGWIVKNHPYEMVYFNSIGQKYAEYFDRDYWHLSEIHAWKYIAEIDDSDTISVNTSGYQFFTHVLEKNEKKRVEISNNPTYFIETYRGIVGNQIEKEGYEEIHSIIVDDFKVATIFKKIDE